MDPSTIAALSGAPSTVVLAWLIAVLIRDRKVERKDFLRALSVERRAIERLGVTIQRQSALLLTVVEQLAPGRSEAIQAQVAQLFQAPPAEPPARGGEEDDEGEF